MEDILPIIIGLTLFLLVQYFVYRIFTKRGKILIALLPNAVFFIVGLLFALVIALSALSGNTFADLGTIVVVMLTAIATMLSVVASLLIIVFVRQRLLKK
jgi:hypothetical protein